MDPRDRKVEVNPKQTIKGNLGTAIERKDPQKIYESLTPGEKKKFSELHEEIMDKMYADKGSLSREDDRRAGEEALRQMGKL